MSFSNAWPRVLLRKLFATRWNIGFLDITDMGAFIAGRGSEIRWLQHSFRDRWFADPFILNVNEDTIELLVEEWVDDLRRGRISKLVVDRTTARLIESIPVLDNGKHLSFPAIHREGGDIFVYPESSGEGRTRFYRYDYRREALTLEGTMVELPLTDAIILPEPINGRYFMFSTRQPNPSGTVLDIYVSDRWNGGYSKHQTISFADRSARGAGEFFKHDGCWVRAAQDCNRRYGHGLVFQRIENIGMRFTVTELGRKYPVSRCWNLGLHTFNTISGLAVVDGYAWRTPYIGAALETLGVSRVARKASRKIGS